jgi:hypothetical protein
MFRQIFRQNRQNRSDSNNTDDSRPAFTNLFLQKINAEPLLIAFVISSILIFAYVFYVSIWCIIVPWLVMNGRRQYYTLRYFIAFITVTITMSISIYMASIKTQKIVKTLKKD